MQSFFTSSDAGGRADLRMAAGLLDVKVTTSYAHVLYKEKRERKEINSGASNTYTYHAEGFIASSKVSSTPAHTLLSSHTAPTHCASHACCAPQDAKPSTTSKVTPLQTPTHFVQVVPSLNDNTTGQISVWVHNHADGGQLARKPNK